MEEADPSKSELSPGGDMALPNTLTSQRVNPQHWGSRKEVSVQEKKGREVGTKHGDTMRAPECSHRGCLIYRTGKSWGQAHTWA